MAKNALPQQNHGKQNHPLTERAQGAPLETTRRSRGPLFTPRCDIVETRDELVLFADLPGVKADNLDVHYENGELTIHGRCEPRHEGADLLAYEYGVGDFYRVFSIGEMIDADKITAELKQGALTVHLPKSEAVKPKRITVKSE